MIQVIFNTAMKISIKSFFVKSLLATVGVYIITSCSTPGAGPTPGQQAVLASAAHRTTQTELDQQVAFMRSFQQMQGRVK